MKILITGSNGFIGSALCRRLSVGNNVIGVDLTDPLKAGLPVAWEQADLTDKDSVDMICRKHASDVIIHCAGIAHQKIGTVASSTYMSVNSEATEHIAKMAAAYNPNLTFIFLSSVSVYGEADKRGPVPEDSLCKPSSDYAVSKLDAEERLVSMHGNGTVSNMIILRLAPVYDRNWSLNLDRRVFAPGKTAYIRFGSGRQLVSALARPNLVDFIEFLLERCRKDCYQDLRIFNVCDSAAYEFSEIIDVFKRSGVHSARFVVPVPLFSVWLITRMAGMLFSNKKKWIHSCYAKLAYDLSFDNEKMIKAGFRPAYTLRDIFLS